MNKPKIVIIGAGSAIFGPNTIATLLRSPYLRHSTLALVDIDAMALDRVTAVAQRMNEEWHSGVKIVSGPDHRTHLDGADFVIVAIEVPPREELWRRDWEIPLEHGLRQPYGENGGPGGMMHTFRQIPPLLRIVRDMETQCPSAHLINFSNPLPRLSRAITKYSTIRVAGKCHQIDVGYAIAAVLLRQRYGLAVGEDVALYSDLANVGRIHHLTQLGRDHVRIRAAGLNHFTWIVDIRDRETGEDLYPELREAREEAPEDLEPFSMELFRIFDYCPVPGDTHLCEYLPWAHDPVSQPWETYHIRLYDWESGAAFREFGHHRLAQMGRGDLSIDGMCDAKSEGAVEIIEAVVANLNRYEEAINIPNRGAIPNLPDETIVELPCVVGGDGIHGLSMAPLPEPIAELCRREAALVEMIVDAGVHGDRALALQALLLDPMVGDLQRARRILDKYLQEFSAFLPQFA